MIRSKVANRQGATRRGPGGSATPGKSIGQPQFTDSRLGQCLNRIRAGWLSCAGTVGSTRAERRSSFLKQEVYKLAWQIRETPDLDWTFQRLDEERGRSLKASAVRDDLHYAIISAVLSRTELSGSQQTEYARTLSYAERHKVPREYLLGFLGQIDKRSVNQKLADPLATEPWFDAALAQRVWVLYEDRYRELESESGSGEDLSKTKAVKPGGKRKTFLKKASANKLAKRRHMRRARTTKLVS